MAENMTSLFTSPAKDFLLGKVAERAALYYRPIFTLDDRHPAWPGDNSDDEEEDDHDDDRDEEDDEDDDEDGDEYDSDEEEGQQPYITVNFAHELPPPNPSDTMVQHYRRYLLSKRPPPRLFPHNTEDKQAAKDIAEIKSILSNSIKKGKVQELSPKFLSLCREGIWAFKCPDTRWFLSKISPELGANILSVAIMSGMLYGDDYPSRKCWSKGPHSTELVPFAQAMKDKLPNLKDVALFLPFTNSDYYCSYAPPDICDLLKDGHIDTVRIFFEEALPEDWEIRNDVYMSHVLRPEIPPGFWEDDGYEERNEAHETYHDLLAVTRDEKTNDRTELRARYGTPDVETAFTLRRHDEASKKASREKNTAAYLKEKLRKQREREAENIEHE